MRFKKIINYFENHSVSVCGTKGSGKDLLMGNVVARRKYPYASNFNYTHDNKFIPLDFKVLDLGGNTRRNLVKGDVKYYEIPYPENCDIYISDCGVYFPSQYCNELNKEYPNIAIFAALSRHLNNSRLHTNTQHLGRVYDKLREQSDIYIRCEWVCKPLLKLTGIVLQQVTIYDKYESALNRVRPCRVSFPLFNFDRTAETQVQIYRDNFFNQHGEVKTRILIYKNKANYDNRYFKQLFANGRKEI